MKIKNYMNNNSGLKEGLHVERIDDIPVIITSLQKIGLGNLLDELIPVHKNWEGLSLGKLAEIWMSYIVSEGDHRLNQLEDWAFEKRLLFETLYEGEEIKRTDFTDDKLGKLLDYLSDKENWLGIESRLNKRIFTVYKIKEEGEDMLTVRLDATIGQGYRKADTGSLFQFGASKHFNSSLPQFKIMLSTLESEINGFAYPVASITVPGNTTDDVLYTPILEQTKNSLNTTDKLLIVGDKKLGSQSNRAHIVSGGDYYLSPLSEVQVSSSDLKLLIEENEAKIKGVKVGDNYVGKGFTYTQAMSVSIDQEEEASLQVDWLERRFVFQSTAHAKSQTTAFDKKIEKTKGRLENLLVRKQRKKTPSTKTDISQAVEKILKDSKLEEYINVEILESTEAKKIRGYKGAKGRTVKIHTFDLSVELDMEKVKDYKSFCGWCIYATNAPQKRMKIKDAIQMYRGQFQIESRFNDLKNKVTKLMPVFLQKEERVLSLINFMMIGLKLISAIEIKVAKKLKEKKEKLQGTYAGNPKRGTEKPTAKAMLTRLKGISISVFIENGKPKYIGLTPLDKVQQKILKLMGIKSDLYSRLVEKMNLNFSG